MLLILLFGAPLAALLFIRRVANTTSVARVTDALVEEGRLHSLQGVTIPEYAAVFRIHGPFLFGATDKLERISDHLSALPPIVIVRLRHVPAMMPQACRHSRISRIGCGCPAVRCFCAAHGSSRQS